MSSVVVALILSRHHRRCVFLERRQPGIVRLRRIFERPGEVCRLRQFFVRHMTIALWIMLFAGGLLVAVLSVSLLRYLSLRPVIWQSAPTNALVLVAHPDDCVVLAGEYALWVLDHGMGGNCLLHFRGGRSGLAARENARARRWRRGARSACLGRVPTSWLRPVPNERNLRPQCIRP